MSTYIPFGFMMDYTTKKNNYFARVSVERARLEAQEAELERTARPTVRQYIYYEKKYYYRIKVFKYKYIFN